MTRYLIRLAVLLHALFACGSTLAGDVSVYLNHGHSSPLSDLIFLDNGERFITFAYQPGEYSQSTENSIKLWESRSGRLIRSFTVAGGIGAAAVSPDGKRIVGVVGDSMHVWNADTGAQVSKHRLPFSISAQLNSMRFGAMVFSESGTEIGVLVSDFGDIDAGGTSMAYVLRVHDGKVLKKKATGFDGHSFRTRGRTIHLFPEPNGGKTEVGILNFFPSLSVVLRQLNGGDFGDVSANSEIAGMVKITPRGQRMVIVSNQKQLSELTVKHKADSTIVESAKDLLDAVPLVGARGDWAAFSLYDAKLALYEKSTDTMPVIDTEMKDALALSFIVGSADERFIAAVSEDKVRIIERKSGKLVAKIDPPDRTYIDVWNFSKKKNGVVSIGRSTRNFDQCEIVYFPLSIESNEQRLFQVSEEYCSTSPNVLFDAEQKKVFIGLIKKYVILDLTDGSETTHDFPPGVNEQLGKALSFDGKTFTFCSERGIARSGIGEKMSTLLVGTKIGAPVGCSVDVGGKIAYMSSGPVMQVDMLSSGHSFTLHFEKPSDNRNFLQAPTMSPGGRRLAVPTYANGSDGQLRIVSIDGKAIGTLPFDHITDHLMWESDDSLLVSTAFGHARYTIENGKIRAGKTYPSEQAFAASMWPDPQRGRIIELNENLRRIRILNSGDLSEIASVYLEGNGAHLAFLPNGYSDIAGQTGPLLLRHRSAVYDFLTFWDVFHRPDVVKARLRGEDITPLIGNLTIQKALNNPPPSVSLERTGAAKGDSKRISVAYRLIPAGGGIAEVRVFHNGKLIRSDGAYKDAPGKAYAPVAGKSAAAAIFAGVNRKNNAVAIESATGAAGLPNALTDQLIVRAAPEKTCSTGQAGDPCVGKIDVDILPGEDNIITVVAFNRDNSIQSTPVSINYTSTLPKEQPQLWVLGVGIDRFKGIAPLNNARKDAQDFVCTYAGKDALAKLGIACKETGHAASLFKPANIHVVGALLDQHATKSNILQALGEVAARAKPGDTFVWFVASHGMMDANSLFGFIAHDTQCLNADCTDLRGHITSNEILDASKKIMAMKQLVILDTCHSGGLDNKLSGLYDARVSLLAKNMGLHLYASAQATEKAQDGQPGTNGAFTMQLLRGIKGAAPKNSEGQISVMTLGQWVKRKTIEATASTDGIATPRAAQTPVIQHFGLDAGLVVP